MSRRSKGCREICYACDQISVTREHIPPKVFFPEKKDMPKDFPNFREHLITVPSCETHNLNKSLEDEYAFMIIAACFGVNEIALIYSKKISRAISHSPCKAGIYLNNYRHATIAGLPTIAPSVDTDRLNVFFTLLAKGIYYHHYHNKWKVDLFTQPLSFFLPSISEEAKQVNSIIQKLRDNIGSLFSNEEKFGSQQSIFYYQFHHEEAKVLRMVFYEGFEVMVSEI